MALRVIAGRAHGRRLRVPAGGTRPTSGLVRGALFNMLEHRGWLAGARVLDLFAGSGALGIEALSRGAGHVVFVEEAPAAVRVLRANVAASGFAEGAEVLPMPVSRALRMLGRGGVCVDGIFVDPPYGAGWIDRVVEEVDEAGVLAPGGWVALEHRPDEPVAAGESFRVIQTRRHGGTALTLLTRRESPA